MRKNHRKEAYYYRFYAGKDKPIVLCRERFDMEVGNPTKCLICFVQEDKSDKVWFGLYEGAQILPLYGEYEQIAQDLAGEAWREGSAQSIPVPLRTVLSKEQYLGFRDEPRLINDASDAATDNSHLQNDLDNQLSRWQYALLVIGFTAFLSVGFGSRLVWSSFYLLNGTDVLPPMAACIYLAWSIPLTIINALINRHQRTMYAILLFSLCPLGVRAISLLRNYSISIMWVAIALLVIATGLFFWMSFRAGIGLHKSLEYARILGASILVFSFPALLIVDTFIPQLSVRKIERPSTIVTQTDKSITEESRALLNSDEWSSASAERKAQVLYEVMEEVCVDLGFDPPTMYLDAQADGSYDAYYQWGGHEIHVWKPALEHYSAATAVNMILHESFHAYQNMLIHSTAINWDDPDMQRLSYLKALAQWRQDQEKYVNVDRWDSNLESYYEQSLEADAYRFAEKYTDYFFQTDDEEKVTP